MIHAAFARQVSTTLNARIHAPVLFCLYRYIGNTNLLFTPGKFLFNTMVSNTITVEQIAGMQPDYQRDKFSISKLMSQVQSLLETQNEKPSI